MVLSGRDVEMVFPLCPLGDFSEYPHGANSRPAAEAVPESFYRSLFALALSTLRFGNMSWGAADGRLELPALCNLSSAISRQWLRTVDFRMRS